MSTFAPDPAPAYTEQWNSNPDSEIIVFCGKEMLLREGEDVYRFPKAADLESLSIRIPSALSIGERNGVPCYAVELEQMPELSTELVKQVEVRIAVGNLDDSSFTAGCRAKELLHWRRQHRFCGNCGGALTESKTDVAMLCPECGERFYPQLAPAVIVAITRGDEILLAHNKKFRPGIYGLIAGFVEAGENIEQAIRREVYEETGIKVGNFRYDSSQCWPFPNSLMLGFTAEYVSGEAVADSAELESLGWFHADHLPMIPPHGSIARRLIDDFQKKHTRKH